MACGLAIHVDFDTLTALASSTLLAIYLVSCTGPLVPQRRRVGEDHVRLRLPGGHLIPLVATAIVIGLMTTLTGREVIAVLVVVLIASATYGLSRTRPSATGG